MIHGKEIRVKVVKVVAKVKPYISDVTIVK